MKERHVFYRYTGFVSVAAAMLFGLSGDAHAQMMMGDVIDNVTQSIAVSPNILSAISYLSGLFLGVWGIFKFKDHVDNPSQTKISEGVKRFIAGGMFLALPYVVSSVQGTLLGAGNEGNFRVTNTGYSACGGCLTPGGLDEMVVKMMANIGAPLEALLTAFCYISGIALIMVGVSRLTKRMEEGPRGPAGMGTLMTFIAGGALVSFGDMAGVFSSSLFGDDVTMTKASIAATVISDAGDRAKIQKVVEAVMVFVTLVGYIAFIRGWFVLKAFADGQNGATLAQGLTFLFGGAVAINLGELVNVLQDTVGIGGALTFS